MKMMPAEMIQPQIAKARFKMIFVMKAEYRPFGALSTHGRRAILPLLDGLLFFRCIIFLFLSAAPVNHQITGRGFFGEFLEFGNDFTDFNIIVHR